MHLRRNEPHGRIGGFSLIELVTSLVVVGLVVPAIAVGIQSTMQQNVRSEDRTVCLELARAMMDEIYAHDFDDPDSCLNNVGPEEGLRIDFDDVDDYDGWSQSPPLDSTGVGLAGLAGYTRSVAVHNVAAGDLNTPVADGTTPFKRITVSVSDGVETVTLRCLKARVLYRLCHTAYRLEVPRGLMAANLAHGDYEGKCLGEADPGDLICHKPSPHKDHTIKMPSSGAAISAHVAHGDTLGACPP